jgi:hypothetical protein
VSSTNQTLTAVGGLELLPDSLEPVIADLWVGEQAGGYEDNNSSNRISFGIPLSDGSEVWTDIGYRQWWPPFRSGCQ